MKKNTLYAFCILILAVSACKKEKDEDEVPAVPVTAEQVLIDFATVLAVPNYADVAAKAVLLNNAVTALNANPNTSNLQAAQAAWRAVRIPWEQSEAFLFGPAEDYNYDPATDTWPVNTAELDSLLASSNPLMLADIEGLQYSLRGYHPIEYVLFGVGGSRIPSELTQRNLQYVVSLSQDLVNTTTDLSDSWDENIPNNFTEQLITAGNGSVRYATRKDAFLALAGAMIGICEEVANGKMEEPLAAHDSTLVESQYAHNATIDFRNNMVGIENAYFSRYNSVYGKSLHNYVEERQSALDNAIKASITNAIAALDVLDPNYGLAIYTQQGQIIAAQQAINDLKDNLGLLENFIHANITE
jgi:putative iron-regulated protein